MKYDSDYGQKGFIRTDTYAGPVEHHWNLVNSPTLRKGVSVELHDLQLKSDSPEKQKVLSPAGLLLTASVHGATSHCFDKLRILNDIRQLVRGSTGEIDTGWLSATAKRTGSCLCVVTALELTARTLKEPKSTELLQKLNLTNQPGIRKLLLNPSVVFRAHATIDSPRRSIFRQMLKRSR